jgi:NitT/TauT family transport system substrate-binding protein
MAPIMSRAFVVGVAALLALSAPTLAQPTRIEVSLGDVSLQKVPFIIAADAGIYAKNGLDVHQFITPRAARAVEGIGIHVPTEYIGKEHQTAPIEVGGGAPLIYSAGQPGSRPHYIIVATNENIVRDHIITRADIRSEQDLKGKKLASSFHNVTGYDGVVYLRRLGLTDQVTITEAADLDDLKAGKVDALMATLFMTAKAPQDGLTDLVDLSKYNIAEPGSGICIDPQYLAANRDIVARFVKASIEATARMKTDKTIFAATLAKWFNVTDAKIVDRLFVMAQGFPDKPYPSVEGIKTAMDVFTSPILVKAKPEEFYDSSFIAALDKDGTLDRLAKKP